MSNQSILILVIAIVVVLALVAVSAMMMRKRKTEQDHARAEELRSEAAANTSAVDDSRRQAEAADLEAQQKRIEADRARLEAEQAEHQAAQVQQGVQVDEAHHEDTLRTADQVDPTVDHRADGYTPTSDTATSDIHESHPDQRPPS